MKVLFLHGKESGPHGSKYQALVAAGYKVTSPDLTGLDLPDRVRVTRSILDREAFDVVVGSSMGGATAILALQGRNDVHSLVLCAPAVDMLEESDYRFPSNTVVIQGTQDAIVTHQSVLAFCLARDLCLVSVPDDHRLSQSLDHILGFVRHYGAKG